MHYALLKSIEKLCHFILSKHSEVKVHFPVVKLLLSQTLLSRKLGHWLTKILEHDLTVTTTNIIKGHDSTLHLDHHLEPRFVYENNDEALSGLFLIV
jgi:hypothetical protein